MYNQSIEQKTNHCLNMFFNYLRLYYHIMKFLTVPTVVCLVEYNLIHSLTKEIWILNSM